MQLQAISDTYQDLFNTMVISPTRLPEAETVARQILKGKDIYSKISANLQASSPGAGMIVGPDGKLVKLAAKPIPWYFIGIIHSMECSCNFGRHLHNGDPLRARTIQVPKGRPLADPWNGKGAAYTFTQSAQDALTMLGFHVQGSWNLNLCLYRLEKYNGFGYIRQGIKTPYLWAATSHYTKGKFTSDGDFDKNAVSTQIGAAVLIRLLTDKTLDVV